MSNVQYDIMSTEMLGDNLNLKKCKPQVRSEIDKFVHMLQELYEYYDCNLSTKSGELFGAEIQRLEKELVQNIQNQQLQIADKPKLLIKARSGCCKWFMHWFPMCIRNGPFGSPEPMNDDGTLVALELPMPRERWLKMGLIKMTWREYEKQSGMSAEKKSLSKIVGRADIDDEALAKQREELRFEQLCAEDFYEIEVDGEYLEKIRIKEKILKLGPDDFIQRDVDEGTLAEQHDLKMLELLGPEDLKHADDDEPFEDYDEQRREELCSGDISD